MPFDEYFDRRSGRFSSFYRRARKNNFFHLFYSNLISNSFKSRRAGKSTVTTKMV